MSELTGLDVEAVLRDHEYAIGHLRGSICLCGFIPTVDPETLVTQQDYHRAHVAAVLRVEIESALADAWGEGFAAAGTWTQAERAASRRFEAMPPLPSNPYRPTLAATEGDRQ